MRQKEAKPRQNPCVGAVSDDGGDRTPRSTRTPQQRRVELMRKLLANSRFNAGKPGAGVVIVGAKPPS